MRIAPWVDPVLEDITRTIADEFQPSRIVLFGSRARGDSDDDSDYDLMVELDTDRERVDVRHAVDSALTHLRGRASVDVKVRLAGEFERRRDDPGTVDYDIAREGVILYPAALRGPMPPGSTRSRAPSDEQPESVPTWLERADADLLAVAQLLAAEPSVWMAIAFHAQQAAEKYLKTLIIAHWRKPPRTHRLAELVDLLSAVGCVLPDLSRECKTLEPYGVGVRYPERQPLPTEAEGRAAVMAGAGIVAAVRGRLGRP